MLLDEITDSTPTATGQQILGYVNQQHHDFRNPGDVLAYDHWQLENVPLSSLIFDDSDRDDPLGRVLDVDYEHVDRIISRGPSDILTRPIVVDPSGAIIDGNHRAVAARELGMTTVPAWVPTQDLAEQNQSLKFLRPGELRGSYTDAQLQALGFRRAKTGAWFIGQRRWEQLTQSGQVREQQLDERVSGTIYHYTNLYAARRILQSGQFELSSTLGSKVEAQFAPPGYRYFLSATRTRTGGYHDYVGDTAVMFVLDGNWFNSRYPGGAVDYWQNRAPGRIHHRAHEAEDRIYSRERSIPIDGVSAIHVLVKTDSESRNRAWARQLIIRAKQLGIPVYLYDNKQAWRALDTRRTVSPNYLRGQDPAGDRGTRGHRGYLMPWMELLQARDKSQLTKHADKIRYNLAYTYDRGEAAKQLDNDLFNARKPSAGPDREHAVKIANFMRRMSLDTVQDLVDYLAAKWNPKKAVAEDPDTEHAAIEQAAIDFYQRNTRDQAQPVRDYVQQAGRLLRRADADMRDQVRSVLVRARKNPYIQGGVITAVGALLAGAALTSAQRMGLTPTQTNMLLQAILNTVIPTMVSRVNGRNWRDTIKYTLASMGVGTGIAAITEKTVDENFADGRKPGRRGLAKRMGVNCKQPVSKLRKIAKNSSGERARMAHWCANMKSGRAKKNK